MQYCAIDRCIDMFWNREKPDTTPKAQKAAKPNAKPEAQPNGPVASTTDDSIDALAEVLRSFGEGAFELEHQTAEEVRELCEAWARHLLVGIAPPDYPAAGEEWKTGAEAIRDYPGVQRFFRNMRNEESRFLGQSLTNMFETIWAFIAALRHTLSFDEQNNEQVAHRLRRLESAAQGNNSERLKHEALETVELVRESMKNRGANEQKLIASMGVRLETMRAELSVVREQATCDSLTGLFNRSALDEHLERLTNMRNVFDREAVLFMIDIDHFKWVNDTYGHATGDSVLSEVGACLTRTFGRKEDFVARYGGEEFCIALQEGRPEIIKELSERALYNLRDLEFETGAEPLRISASLGVAILHVNEPEESWLKRADDALYLAKEAGRDRVVLHADDAE